MSAPLILGTNSIKDVGYNVDNSAMFNRADGAYMDRTFSSAGNRDKWTYSLWIKKCKNGVEQRLLTTSDNATFDDNIRFNSDDSFNIICNNTTVLKTNRLFRDPSAWYHICVIWDSGNATSGDRCQLWVNGVRETSFSTESYPSQNQDSFINNNTRHYIGVTNVTANSHFFDGYLTEVVFQNDSAETPVDKFGSYDEDSGIWKPIDVSGLTFGTNGFYLDFEDSSALGNDVSGNNNDFTVNNLTSIDQTTDTCTNNYATLNPLDNYYYNSTFSDGNLKQTCNSANYSYNTSTFGVSQGKWYVEIKNSSSGTIRNEIGIIDRVSTGSTTQIYGGVNGYGWFTNGNVNNNSSIIATYSTWTAGDIMGIALDLDNNKVYFAKNGTWQNSADPSAGTNGISITDPASTLNGVYFIATGDYGGSDNSVNELNFGNPTFTISSGNSDANGYGNFEYSVPANYYSLNVKNLAEYG